MRSAPAGMSTCEPIATIFPLSNRIVPFSIVAPLTADDIERIDVATFGFAAAMRNPDPPNFFASKYSLPHAAAALVVTKLFQQQNQFLGMAVRIADQVVHLFPLWRSFVSPAKRGVRTG